jgi:hypothetical protein
MLTFIYQLRLAPFIVSPMPIDGKAKRRARRKK